jgi:hypothetical protein
MEEYDTLVLRSSHHRVEQGIHIMRRNFSREACPKCTLEIAPELAHLKSTFFEDLRSPSIGRSQYRHRREAVNFAYSNHQPSGLIGYTD